MEKMDTFLVYCQNLNGVQLCNSLEHSGKTMLSRVGLGPNCSVPAFLNKIVTDISVYKPFLIAVSTEDETSRNSGFHSNLLKDKMRSLNYKQLKIKKLDKFFSGNTTRLSIYVHESLEMEFQLEEKEIHRNFSGDGQFVHLQNEKNRSSGVIVSIVWHPEYGRFAFATFNLTSENNMKNYLKYRDYIVSSNASVINLTTLKVEGIKTFKRPEYIIIMGNLGFDIVNKNDPNYVYNVLQKGISYSDLKEIQKYDELRTNHILSDYNEGEANNGPLFLPTSILKRGRDLNTCNFNKDNSSKIEANCFEGQIGWRERILYKELEGSNSPYTLHCIGYNRNDSIQNSSNAGVYSIFQLKERTPL